MNLTLARFGFCLQGYMQFSGKKIFNRHRMSIVYLGTSMEDLQLLRIVCRQTVRAVMQCVRRSAVVTCFLIRRHLDSSF